MRICSSRSAVARLIRIIHPIWLGWNRRRVVLLTELGIGGCCLRWASCARRFLISLGDLTDTSLSGRSGPGDSGRGLGAVPRRSASPGPLLSIGLVVNRGVVSFVPLRLGAGLACSLLAPPEPDLSGAGLGSSGYGARRGSEGRGYSYVSSSSGYGRGLAELEAPGGSGNVSLLLDGAGISFDQMMLSLLEVSGSTAC